MDPAQQKADSSSLALLGMTRCLDRNSPRRIVSLLRHVALEAGRNDAAKEQVLDNVYREPKDYGYRDEPKASETVNSTDRNCHNERDKTR